MNKKIYKDELWCEYSDMPSPLSYIKNKSYGGVVSHEKSSKKEQDGKKNSKTITLVVTQVPKEETKINLGPLK